MGEILDDYLYDMERAVFYNNHELSGHRPARPINPKESMRTMSTNVTTGEVRLSYVNLFQPRATQQGDEPKYSVTILLPKSDTTTYQRIQAAIQAAYEKGVAEKWNGARPPLKTTIHDGDGLRPSGEPFGPECKGHWVFTASSKQKPEVVDVNLNPVIDQSKVYSGVYGRVNLNFFAYANSGNRGVSAGLGPVQILRDGEPLGGRVTAADVFGAAPTSASAPSAPTYSQPGGYVPPAAPSTPTYGQPAVSQQPAAPQFGQQPPQQIDPITGQPLGGGIYGI